MPSRNVDLGTIEEWRELGFFYEVDNIRKLWRLTGDRSGLLRFAKKIRDYAVNPKNKMLSEHEHFGPYFYLTITTGVRPEISESSWTGSPSDLLHLAELIENNLAGGQLCEFKIGGGFAPETAWEIHFKVEKDGFDPSSIDPLIEHRS